MATSSALSIDKDQIKLVQRYYASTLQEAAHYNYEIKEKVYIYTSNLTAKEGSGYNSVYGIESKGVIKNIFKPFYESFSISGAEWRKLGSELSANLVHD